MARRPASGHHRELAGARTPTMSPVTNTESARTDWGRIIAIAVFSLLVLANVVVLLGAPSLGESAPAVVSRVLTIAFLVLLVVAYVRRSKATATDHHPLAWSAGLAAYGAPFLLPLVGGNRSQEGTRGLIASAVLIVGIAFMLWSLRNLGSNISVVPQAREVVTTGPYAWVRHPLYAAELINTGGVCLAFHGVWPWVVLAGLAGLQYVRARREEALLAATLPGYEQYRERTPMLIPRPPRRAADD